MSDPHAERESEAPVRRIEPLELSVITSWWAPSVGFRGRRKDTGGSTDSTTRRQAEYLPSLQKTLQAGLGVVDYYYFPEGELGAWKRMLGVDPNGNPGDVHRRLVQSKQGHYELSRRMRTHFASSPMIGTRNGIRAIATNAIDIGQRLCWAAEGLGIGNSANERKLQGALAKLSEVRRFVFSDSSKAEDCPRKKQGECPRLQSGITCGLYVIAAALRLAAVTGATVVEIVGGLAGTAKPEEPGRGGFFDFQAALEAEEKDQETLKSLINPKNNRRDDPFLGAMLARKKEEEHRRKPNWLRSAPEPARVLAWNLFCLARFILTQLPPTDDPYCPPVSIGLEIEPALCWLNSIRRYDEVIACYRELTQRYVNKLETAEDCREFRGHENLDGPPNKDQFTRLFEACVGLNVDIGHMLLTGTHPCEVAPLCQLGIAGSQKNVCPYGWEIRTENGREKCPWLQYPESIRNRRIESILHYHLSDHYLVHYCDLPPGERHAKAEFFPWLQQAFALRQMLTNVYGAEGEDARGDIGGPRRHPNFSGCVALELEANPGGIDQVVTAHARVNRWIQEVMETPLLDGGG